MMTEATPLAVAAIRFRWQKDDKTYDYFIPKDLTVKVGDKVVVETAGRETSVEVVEIKASSDKAQKNIVRIIEPNPTVEGEVQ